MRRIATLVLLASIALVGCAGPDASGSTPSDAPEAATATPAATPVATPTSTSVAGPDATGDAQAELDAFLAAIAGHSPADPDALVASVEAAGFPRSSIERTREVDSLGAPVTFLEIAVLTDDGCLIGQVGDGEPMAVRASALGGGRCLVGEVVALD